MKHSRPLLADELTTSNEYPLGLDDFKGILRDFKIHSQHLQQQRQAEFEAWQSQGYYVHVVNGSPMAGS